MFKRRDWLHVKGQDGGASDSTDSDSDSELSGDVAKIRKAATAAAGSSSDTEGDEPEASSGSEGDSDSATESDDDIQAHRDRRRFARSFDDISDPDEDDDEDGFGAGSGDESEDHAPDVSAQDIIRVWESDDKEALQFKGIPLRCVACDVLLLNSITYKQHTQSKKHRGKVKAWDVGERGEPIQLAEESNKPKEEEETHAERAARISAAAAAAAAAQQQGGPSLKGANKQATQQRQQTSCDREDFDSANDGSDSDIDGSGSDGDADEPATTASGPPGRTGNGDNHVTKKRRRKGQEKVKRPGKNQRAKLKAELASKAAGSSGDSSAQGAGPSKKQLAKLKRVLHGREAKPGSSAKAKKQKIAGGVQ